MNMDPIKREPDIDQWLDAALSQYAKAEPRAGLEGRVLATLQAERNWVGLKRSWWGGAGAVVAIASIAAIAVAVWLGQGHRARTPSSAGTTATRRDDGAGDRAAIDRQAIDRAAKDRPAVHPEVHPAPRQPIEQGASQASRRPPAQRTVHAPEVAVVARLEQFPAPTPLSDQEKLLARYVQEFPHRAALIARAQTELQKSDEFEMAAPWPMNANAAGSERQE